MHRSPRPKSLLATLVATVVLVAMTAMPVGAITKGGVVDTAESFPHVGLMVAGVEDEEGNFVPLWRCSGTLVSPILYVTAGHCTDGATHVEIWFNWDVRSAAEPTYPFVGDVSGTPFTHPDYDPNAFFLHDMGVVVLDTPYDTGGVYADLPTEGQLDALKPGKRSLFETVGYGLQRSFPPDTPAEAMLTESERIRMVATPHLLQINNANVGDFAMLVSNNSATGGTCFGDSGGPSFIGDTIVAVTSFGLTYTCAGVGGVYRIDQPDDLGWIHGEFQDEIDFSL